jgi:hypothetical protein
MTNTDSWKDFGGKYLKAQNVTSDKDKYVIVAVGSEIQNDKTTLILTLEREGTQKLFGCNTTNENAVMAVCPNSPDQAVGSIITFTKERVRNPGTNQMVDGLRIAFTTTELVEPSNVDTDEAGIDTDSTM